MTDWFTLHPSLPPAVGDEQLLWHPTLGRVLLVTMDTQLRIWSLEDDGFECLATGDDEDDAPEFGIAAVYDPTEDAVRISDGNVDRIWTWAGSEISSVTYGNGSGGTEAGLGIRPNGTLVAASNHFFELTPDGWKRIPSPDYGYGGGPIFATNDRVTCVGYGRVYHLVDGEFRSDEEPEDVLYACRREDHHDDLILFTRAGRVLSQKDGSLEAIGELPNLLVYAAAWDCANQQLVISARPTGDLCLGVSRARFAWSPRTNALTSLGEYRTWSFDHGYLRALACGAEGQSDQLYASQGAPVGGPLAPQTVITEGPGGLFAVEATLRRLEDGGWEDLADLAGPEARHEAFLAPFRNGLLLCGGVRPNKHRGLTDSWTWLPDEGWKKVKGKTKPAFPFTHSVQLDAKATRVACWRTPGLLELYPGGPMKTVGIAYKGKPSPWLFDGRWHPLPPGFAAAERIFFEAERELVFAVNRTEAGFSLMAWTGTKWAEARTVPAPSEDLDEAEIGFDSAALALVLQDNTTQCRMGIELTGALDEVAKISAPVSSTVAAPVKTKAPSPDELPKSVYLEDTESGFKFWQGKVVGGDVEIAYGAIGKKSRSTSVRAGKTHPKLLLHRRAEAKRNKGYKDVPPRSSNPVWTMKRSSTDKGTGHYVGGDGRSGDAYSMAMLQTV